MDQSLEVIFKQFLKRENLLEAPLLLLVSGGVDSMTLLDVATKSHPSDKIHVIYFHHQTRKANDEEWEMIQSVCEQHGVNFRGEKLEKVDRNQEEIWRNSRKKFSTKYAQKHKISHILTAHHATDLVETMIFRLVKGCGVGGLDPFGTGKTKKLKHSKARKKDLLTCQLASSPASFSKPFWQIPKTDLVAYAEQNDLQWMEDPTNAENDHDRNLIRNEVIPHLRQITPNLEKVFVNESKTFGHTADYLQQQIESLPLHKGDTGGLTLDEFHKLHPILQTELLRSVCDQVPSMAEMEDFLRWINHKPQGGSQKELGGVQFQIREKCLVWHTN